MGAILTPAEPWKKSGRWPLKNGIQWSGLLQNSVRQESKSGKSASAQHRRCATWTTSAESRKLGREITFSLTPSRPPLEAVPWRMWHSPFSHGLWDNTPTRIKSLSMREHSPFRRTRDQPISTGNAGMESSAPLKAGLRLN